MALNWIQLKIRLNRIQRTSKKSQNTNKTLNLKNPKATKLSNSPSNSKTVNIQLVYTLFQIKNKNSMNKCFKKLIK